MNSLNIVSWLKIIVPFLIPIVPALCKLKYGSEYYLLVDSVITVFLWGIVIMLLSNFYRKLLYATIIIVGIFIVYILIMSSWLPIVSQILPSEDRYIGFSFIVIGAFLCCLLVFLIAKVKEYEKYFRLIADGITVIIAIVFLYDSYYGASELVKTLVLNKDFVGLPVIIYLVRFWVSAYVLNVEENKQENNNENLANSE